MASRSNVRPLAKLVSLSPITEETSSEDLLAAAAEQQPEALSDVHEAITAEVLYKELHHGGDLGWLCQHSAQTSISYVGAVMVACQAVLLS